MEKLEHLFFIKGKNNCFHIDKVKDILTNKVWYKQSVVQPYFIMLIEGSIKYVKERFVITKKVLVSM